MYRFSPSYSFLFTSVSLHKLHEGTVFAFFFFLTFLSPCHLPWVSTTCNDLHLFEWYQGVVRKLVIFLVRGFVLYFSFPSEHWHTSNSVPQISFFVRGSVLYFPYCQGFEIPISVSLFVHSFSMLSKDRSSCKCLLFCPLFLRAVKRSKFLAVSPFWPHSRSTLRENVSCSAGWPRCVPRPQGWLK